MLQSNDLTCPIAKWQRPIRDYVQIFSVSAILHKIIELAAEDHRAEVSFRFSSMPWMTAKYLRFLCTKRMKYWTVQQAEIHCFCSCCCQQKINFEQRTKRNEPETIEQNKKKTEFSAPFSLETNGKFIRGKFRGKRNVMTTSLFILFSTRNKKFYSFNCVVMRNNRIFRHCCHFTWQTN